MVTITAAIVLATFRYKSTDFDPADSPNETTSYTNVEYIIDDIIDFINAETGASISNLSGITAGSKSVTVSGIQNAAIKMLLPLMLKTVKYQINSSGNLGPLSTSETVYSQDIGFQKMFQQMLNRLRGSSFERA